MRLFGFFTLLLLIVVALLVLRAIFRARAQRLRPYVSEPTPGEIMRALQQAPVLEQPRAQKAYRGLKVRWRVTFEAAIPLSPISLRLMCQDRGNYPWLLCDVHRLKYPQLKGLVQHTPFWVNGQVSRIHGDNIDLKNVTLDFDS